MLEVDWRVNAARVAELGVQWVLEIAGCCVAAPPFLAVGGSVPSYTSDAYGAKAWGDGGD